MFVVDTNILVYAADAQSPFHLPCLSAVERWRGLSSPWYLTAGICFEFMRIVTHPRALNVPQSAATAWQTNSERAGKKREGVISSMGSGC